MSRHQLVRPLGSAAAAFACMALSVSLLASPAGAQEQGVRAASLLHRRLPAAEVSATPREVAAASALVTPGDPLGMWEQRMSRDFPDTYGGLYVDASGNLVIPTVGAARGLRAWAKANLSAVVTQYLSDALGTGALLGRRTSAGTLGTSRAAGAPALTFTTARRSLADLTVLKADILANRRFAEAGVVGAGIDVKNGAVSVTTSGGSIDATLRADYGSEVETTAATSSSLDASRTSDTPPWNGGDMIGSSSGTLCTLGFGIHDTAGDTYSLTAGHCGYNTWYNVPPSRGSFDDSTRVGTTVSGSKSTWGVDAQLVRDSSSCISWGSGTTRLFITGAADPPQGATIWSEGSVTGQESGRVVTYDWSGNVGGEQLSNLDLTTAAPQPGDSGGPVVYPTGFGPLAGGSVVGLIVYADGTSVGVTQLIDAEIFDYSVRLGTSLAVNTSANGYSC